MDFLSLNVAECDLVFLRQFRMNIEDFKLKWNLLEYFADTPICSYYLIKHIVIYI